MLTKCYSIDYVNSITNKAFIFLSLGSSHANRLVVLSVPPDSGSIHDNDPYTSQQGCGTVNGIKVTFIDTPGFLPYVRRNRKIMLSVKKYIRKPPPDVLYFERLHFINMDCSAFPLLKLLTQQYIHQAVSDSSIEVPVLLVENDPQCKRNILPNGQVWKSQFLLLCICTKVLGDANNLLKLHDGIELGPLTSNQLPSLPSFLRHRLVSDPTEPENGFDEILLSDAEEVEYDQLPSID
ncbi:hypothetical protein Goshw_027622 [Gossypium schwendimanii]|uniref:G domain-containing protein n=1 Tax=Gossypium schwendimanii TaxID=34291 RepID=A0A7J9L5Y1_GOSSC|nr:hypothetical protein [Gossypium schwendimanii]